MSAQGSARKRLPAFVSLSLAWTLAVSSLSAVPHAHAGSRFTFDAGAFSNPPPAFFGVGISVRVTDHFTFGVGYDLLNLLSSSDLYGTDLRWCPIHFERVTVFGSGGVTFYDTPDYDAFLFHGSVGVEWKLSSRWIVVGGLTYVTHTQGGYVLPRLALSYPF